jgi:hypothetical protein
VKHPEKCNDLIGKSAEVVGNGNSLRQTGSEWTAEMSYKLKCQFGERLSVAVA